MKFTPVAMPSAPVKTDLSACASGACGDKSPPSALSPTTDNVAVETPQASTTWRISTMDCTAEESEIRLALEPIQGIRSLSFQLGARTLRIDADDAALEGVVTTYPTKVPFGPDFG